MVENFYVQTNEGISVQEAKTCLLCGKEGVIIYKGLRDRLLKAPGIWSLMRCPNCDLVWVNPRPISSEIKLYEEYYTHQIDRPQKKRFEALRKAIKAKILKREFGYCGDAQGGALSQVLSLISPLREIVGANVMYIKANEKGRLLDVGCGNGRFLAQMRQFGWQVKGVEPDHKAAKLAREYYELEVFEGTLEKASFPDESFDVITMNHVIEHVMDPMQTLVECKRILKAEGKLVVVTSNIQSLGRHLFGKNWRGWEIPRHLFLFSSQSLKALCERAGFKVQRLWTSSKIAPFMWTESLLIHRNKRLLNSYKRLGVWLKLSGLAFWMIEYAICRWGAPQGEEIVLEAVK